MENRFLRKLRYSASGTFVLTYLKQQFIHFQETGNRCDTPTPVSSLIRNVGSNTIPLNSLSFTAFVTVNVEEFYFVFVATDDQIIGVSV